MSMKKGRSTAVSGCYDLTSYESADVIREERSGRLGTSSVIFTTPDTTDLQVPTSEAVDDVLHGPGVESTVIHVHQDGAAGARMIDRPLGNLLARLALPVVGVNCPEPGTHAATTVAGDTGIRLPDFRIDRTIGRSAVVAHHGAADLMLDLRRRQKVEVRMRQ